MTVTKDDLVSSSQNLAGVSREAVLEKSGIAMMKSRSTKSDKDGTYTAESYGSWMSDSGFAVQEETIATSNATLVVVYGIAAGDLTGTNPSENATWSGLMVGTPTTGSRRGEVLQGDAALTYTFDASDPEIDVNFTNIKNIERLRDHSVTSVSFTDVDVAEGKFSATGIEGAFYGTNHSEVAGVFEKSGIVGAFGAN